MITKDNARGLRNLALRNMLQNQKFRPDVTLPKKPPKFPKEWVITEDCAAAPGGSFKRYFAGERITDPQEARILAQEGCPIAAVA